MSRRDHKRTRAPVRLASRPLRAGVSSSCHRPPRHHDRQWRQPCTGGGPTSAGIRYGKRSFRCHFFSRRAALRSPDAHGRGAAAASDMHRARGPFAERRHDHEGAPAARRARGGGKKRTTATTRLCETPYFIRIERGQRVQSTQCTTLFSSALRLLSAASTG